jgi:hypothetical protein
MVGALVGRRGGSDAAHVRALRRARHRLAVRDRAIAIELGRAVAYLMVTDDPEITGET